MPVTCQSEVGKIQTVYIKDVADAFVGEAHIEQ
jgi:hypothetical protein